MIVNDLIFHLSKFFRPKLALLAFHTLRKRSSSLQAIIYTNLANNFRFPGIEKVTLIVSKCDSSALICTTSKRMITLRFPGTNIEICKGYLTVVSLQIGGFLTESENPQKIAAVMTREGCPQCDASSNIRIAIIFNTFRLPGVNKRKVNMRWRDWIIWVILEHQ